MLLVSLQEPQVLLGCVQLLQNLSQHRQHLSDLPSKTMTDILSEVNIELFALNIRFLFFFATLMTFLFHPSVISLCLSDIRGGV